MITRNQIKRFRELKASYQDAPEEYQEILPTCLRDLLCIEKDNLQDFIEALRTAREMLGKDPDWFDVIPEEYIIKIHTS